MKLALSVGSTYDVAKPLRGLKIHYWRTPRLRAPLNISEILVYSSNIGSAEVAEAISAQTQRLFLEKLGLLDYLPA